MGSAETLLIAVSLAVDSCVISLALGLATPKPRGSDALVVGGVMGAFHGAAAALGALLGTSTSELFERFDHWVAFAVLAGLGLKSLSEARRFGRSNAKSATTTTLGLLLAATATSVDVVAVGFGFRLIDEPVAPLAWLTAAITACGSAVSFLGGKRLGARYQRAGLVAGGLVLIAIAANVLREHMR